MVRGSWAVWESHELGFYSTHQLDGVTISKELVTPFDELMPEQGSRLGRTPKEWFNIKANCQQCPKLTSLFGKGDDLQNQTWNYPLLCCRIEDQISGYSRQCICINVAVVITIYEMFVTLYPLMSQQVSLFDIMIAFDVHVIPLACMLCPFRECTLRVCSELSLAHQGYPMTNDYY
jgi:hypothetical protein